MSELVEKVAEMPDLPTRTVQLTGITKSERPDIQFEPAPDAAPAVCEWTWVRPSATSYYGWYRTSHGERTRAYSSSLGKCIACGKPIKFTEAKT